MCCARPADAFRVSCLRCGGLCCWEWELDASALEPDRVTSDRAAAISARVKEKARRRKARRRRGGKGKGGGHEEQERHKPSLLDLDARAAWGFEIVGRLAVLQAAGLVMVCIGAGGSPPVALVLLLAGAVPAAAEWAGCCLRVEPLTGGKSLAFWLGRRARLAARELLLAMGGDRTRLRKASGNDAACCGCCARGTGSLSLGTPDRIPVAPGACADRPGAARVLGLGMAMLGALLPLACLVLSGYGPDSVRAWMSGVVPVGQQQQQQ